MTENEAIKVLENHFHYLKENWKPYPDAKVLDAIRKACASLEEIQQYRAIGTVEDLKSMKENGAFSGVELAQLAAMQMRLRKYEAIGTIDEFKALKEKKPISKNGISICPTCGALLRTEN